MTPKQKLIEAVKKKLHSADTRWKIDFVMGKIYAYDDCLKLIEEILP
jgi:hypothetical protein